MIKKILVYMERLEQMIPLLSSKEDIEKYVEGEEFQSILSEMRNNLEVETSLFVSPYYIHIEVFKKGNNKGSVYKIIY